MISDNMHISRERNYKCCQILLGFFLTSPCQKKVENHKFGRKKRKLRNHINLAWGAACLRDCITHSVTQPLGACLLIHKLRVMVVKDCKEQMMTSRWGTEHAPGRISSYQLSLNVAFPPSTPSFCPAGAFSRSPGQVQCGPFSPS